MSGVPAEFESPLRQGIGRLGSSQATMSTRCSCDRHPPKPAPYDQNSRGVDPGPHCWTLMDTTDTKNTTNTTATITRPTQSQKKRKLMGTADTPLTPERVLKKRPTIHASATPVAATLTTVNAYNKVDSGFRRVLGVSNHQRVLNRTHRLH